MSSSRFSYYTGYEVDDEPSDDEEENLTSKAITNDCAKSESSDDEFDRPIREYIQKNLPQSANIASSSTKSTTSNAFADEMEDELDEIYHNFISRGTFELPLPAKKKSSEKKNIINGKDEESSESEVDDAEKSHVAKNPEDQEKINDDLLYDPEEEDEDEKWMSKQRIRSQGRTVEENFDKSSLGPTDAVLNCPGCMVLICHDCQRHETLKSQYRAMFVFNCTIDENRVAATSMLNERNASKKTKIKSGKRFKTDDENVSNNLTTNDEVQAKDILRPVLCSECGTEVGVYEPKEELYHFANVLASH